MRSSQSIGFALIHSFCAFSQSKSTSPNLETLAGSVKPLKLHTCSEVDSDMLYVGVHGGFGLHGPEPGRQANHCGFTGGGEGGDGGSDID